MTYILSSRAMLKRKCFIAYEVIYERVDSNKENVGLTSWPGEEIKRSDVETAKNYLNEQELDALNKIVTAYLDIAEVHALDQEPMFMQDWLETIDDYLKMTRRDITQGGGRKRCGGIVD